MNPAIRVSARRAAAAIRVVCVVVCTCVITTLTPAGIARGVPPQGAIVAWGCGGVHNYGQCNVPAPNSGFTAVAAGGFHNLGLRADGSIVAWGNNELGQTNIPAPNADFIGIAAGGWHSMGLKADGSIVAWGDNGYDQTNVPPPNADFIGIDAGWNHSLGLKADGSIVAWGCSMVECDSSGCWCAASASGPPSPNTSFVSVAAGGLHGLGLKDDGSIVAWGCGIPGEYGQCNVPAPNADFIGIAAGGRYSLGLKDDGSIVAWGWNAYGQTTVPSPNTDFIGIAAGGGHSLGLKADGSIVAWGLDPSGQTNVPAPNTNFVAIAGGEYHSLAVREAVIGAEACCMPDPTGTCQDIAPSACAGLIPPGIARGPGSTCFSVVPSCGIQPCCVAQTHVNPNRCENHTYRDCLLHLGVPKGNVESLCNFNLSGDLDWDWVVDLCDNCPNIANEDQADCDSDGIGDACAIADGNSHDANANGIPDECEDGACCDLLIGACAEDVLASACLGTQQAWTEGADCVDVACDAVIGACCDHDPFRACADGVTLAACECLTCEWVKLASCSELNCLHTAIPTVGAWGLAILSLLLITGAKIAFGHRVKAA